MSSRYFAWFSALAAITALIPASWLAIQQQGLFTALLNGLDRSPVVWLSLLACIGLVLRAPKEPARLNSMTLNQALLLSLLAALLLIPVALLSWLICALAAWCWLQHTPVSQHCRRAAAILLISAALREPLTQLFLNGFAAQILNFDTWLSALFLPSGESYQVNGNTINQSNGFSLLILTGCSAFTNLSLALLLWLTVMLWRHQHICWQDSWRILLVCLLVLLLNGIRLALMATGPDLYHFLHDGAGAQITDVLLFLCPLLCLRKVSSTPANAGSITSEPLTKRLVDNDSGTSKHAEILNKAVICWLLSATLAAPAIRLSLEHNPAENTPDTTDLSLLEKQLQPLALQKVGELRATNQGDYLIEGFRHNHCPGSIALLPLQRNAEGSHILTNLTAKLNPAGSGTATSASYSSNGIIFAGRLYSDYPEFTVLYHRFYRQLSTLR